MITHGVCTCTCMCIHTLYTCIFKNPAHGTCNLKYTYCTCNFKKITSTCTYTCTSVHVHVHLYIITIMTKINLKTTFTVQQKIHVKCIYMYKCNIKISNV